MICIEKSLLVLIGALIISTKLFGQNSSNNGFPKISQSPYSVNQNAWLNERGFYVINYNWVNQKVNRTLDQALLNRSAGKVTLVASVASLAYGAISFMASEMADEPDRKNDRHKAFFAVSGGLAVISISFSLAGRGKVKKAIALRRKSN